MSSPTTGETAATITRQAIASNLYGLELRRYENVIPRSPQSGGGLARLGSGYLLLTGDGHLYRFKEAVNHQALEVEELATRVPINIDAFADHVKGTPVNLEWFRVTGLAIVRAENAYKLYVAHNFWNHQQQCYVLRVSSIELNASGDLKRAGRWQRLFETKPCLPIKQTANWFAGQQAGGRMIQLADGHLLLSVGDYEFEGVNGPASYPQDAKASYGKTIRIDPNSGESSIFSSGHRNPQGLIRDAEGRIWSTEHGAQGGDELNALQAGQNYGWPVVTYGVNYGAGRSWPNNPEQGRHLGYAEAAFAWIPSIGISNLLDVRSPRFERWHGDLLIASLEGHALWRVRMAGDHPVITERIPIGVRLRDLIEGHQGEVVLWADSNNSLLFLEPASDDAVTNKGEQLWGQCSGCHRIDDGTYHGIGPDLQGVVGRVIASSPNFGYTPALAALGGNWSEERLDAFLANPAQFAPGTSMAIPGISDAAARRILIDYLKARTKSAVDANKN